MKWADSRANYQNLNLNHYVDPWLTKILKFESSIRELIETITTTAKQNIINPEFLRQNSKGSVLQ